MSHIDKRVNKNLSWETSLPVYVPLLPGQSALKAVWLVWTQKKQDMRSLNSLWAIGRPFSRLNVRSFELEVGILINQYYHHCMSYVCICCLSCKCGSDPFSRLGAVLNHQEFKTQGKRKGYFIISAKMFSRRSFNFAWKRMSQHYVDFFNTFAFRHASH